MSTTIRVVDPLFGISRVMEELGLRSTPVTEVVDTHGDLIASVKEFDELPIVNYDPSVM